VEAAALLNTVHRPVYVRRSRPQSFPIPSQSQHVAVSGVCFSVVTVVIKDKRALHYPQKCCVSYGNICGSVSVLVTISKIRQSKNKGVIGGCFNAGVSVCRNHGAIGLTREEINDRLDKSTEMF
jgi:hypothetical protein